MFTTWELCVIQLENSKYCLENSKEVKHPKVQSLSLIFTFAWNLVNYSLCTSKNCFVEGKWLVFSGIVAVISGFLSRLWKKRGKNPHAFKRIWLFVCWFFKPLSRNKTRLFMIFCSNTNHESIPNHILPSKNISGQKKLWKCV